MVTHIIYCIILPYKLLSLSYKIMKNCSEGKKDIAKRMHKPLRENANYDLENNDSRNAMSQRRLELCDFAINYMSHCPMYPRLSTYQDFFK